MQQQRGLAAALTEKKSHDFVAYSPPLPSICPTREAGSLSPRFLGGGGCRRTTRYIWYSTPWYPCSATRLFEPTVRTLILHPNIRQGDHRSWDNSLMRGGYQASDPSACYSDCYSEPCLACFRRGAKRTNPWESQWNGQVRGAWMDGWRHRRPDRECNPYKPTSRADWEDP